MIEKSACRQGFRFPTVIIGFVIVQFRGIHHTNLSTINSKILALIVLFPILMSGCQFSPTSLFRTEIEIDVPREFPVSDHTEMIGKLAVIYTREGDSLPDIARHFGIGFENITNANPHVDIWTPQEGTRILLPMQFILPDAKKKGIVLNLSSLRLFHYSGGQSAHVSTFPVGIGREGWSTPIGSTRIVGKNVNPSWYVPASVLREHAAKGDPLPRVVKPGPDNPLGRYALRLGMPRYLIHGTNKPYGIGMRISHGCVRLYPEDIEILFKQTAVKTTVRIIDQPYLTAWHRGVLYLEAHKALKNDKNTIKKLRKVLTTKLHKISLSSSKKIDWEKVERILTRENGIPTPILKGTTEFAQLLDQLPNAAHPGRFLSEPEILPISLGDWVIVVTHYTEERDAKKLAAILRHQGPSIPSRYFKSQGLYWVFAGPFDNQETAKSASKRILREFGIQPQRIKRL